MITVFRYKLFDQRDRDWVVQLSKSTKARIEALGGRIIDGTAEDVDEAMLDSNEHYIPVAG